MVFLKKSKVSYIIVIFSLFLCSISFFHQHFSWLCTLSSPYTIFIDVGHGGFDPGKVGIDGTLEKDINLSIALQLQTLLIQNDMKVVMSRTEDIALSSKEDSNQKRSDMRNRLEKIRQSNADLIVSIHQNSFPSKKESGAQVFFLANSSKSEILAKQLQAELVRTLDPTNHRKEKSNDSYYLLKNAPAPMVIVECGFLSNLEESAKLNSSTYQQQVAWAIHLGILSYLHQNH